MPFLGRTLKWSGARVGLILTGIDPRAIAIAGVDGLSGLVGIRCHHLPSASLVFGRQIIVFVAAGVVDKVLVFSCFSRLGLSRTRRLSGPFGLGVFPLALV